MASDFMPTPKRVHPLRKRRVQVAHWRSIWRRFSNQLSRLSISCAGYGVILSLLLIFLYLLWEVLPLLRGAQLEAQGQQPLAVSIEQPLALALSPSADLALILSATQGALWIDPVSGQLHQQQPLPFLSSAQVQHFSQADAETGLSAWGLNQGELWVSQHRFYSVYQEGELVSQGNVEFPLPITQPFDPEGRALILTALATNLAQSQLLLAAVSEDQRLLVQRWQLQPEVKLLEQSVQRLDFQAQYLLIDANLKHLLISDTQAQLQVFSAGPEGPAITWQKQLETRLSGMEGITHLLRLPGGRSFLSADTQGQVQQWQLIQRAGHELSLQKLRQFPALSQSIQHLSADPYSKSFLAMDQQGQTAFYPTTSGEEPLRWSASAQTQHWSFAAHPQRLIALDANGLTSWQVHHPHPEISWRTLWTQVHYEGYEAPAWVWQPAVAHDSFEPKFSLTPLMLGTLKTALFSLLFAMPLAIMAAIYTACFMSPGLRAWVKPGIELMEAFPTVIIGFIAGLWLAPWVEAHLASVISLLLFLPFAMLLAGLFNQKWLPKLLKRPVPGSGTELFILLPWLFLCGAVLIYCAPQLEAFWFQGDLGAWLSAHSIDYEQRNAMIVGIAMGFAVIPAIFSIAEDALFNVPRHLTQGALALGASPWQTVRRVVLPAAAAGIFSALMIGLGRALGETMILLMASGNTPLSNFNLFEGMRSLSASLVIELPETAVGSSHYRVLFLAALLLFVFTFVLNTLAEVVRQRLRQHYRTL